MKIVKVTVKNYSEVPSEVLVLDHDVLVPTHEGKECVAQRHRFEFQRLIEDDLEPDESQIN